MPRISVVEQYDNKDLIQQIYRLKELVETGTASNIAVTDNHDGTITVDVTMRDGSIQTFTLANDNIATIAAVQSGGDVTVTVTFESGSTQSFTFNVASGKVDILTTTGTYVYTHVGPVQGEMKFDTAATPDTIMERDIGGRTRVADPPNVASSDYAVNMRQLNTRLTDGSVSKVGTSNVGSDTKPIKLVAGVPTAITNDLVDLPSSQAITGAKTVPLETTGVFSDQIASSNKVKNELDNYSPMVRTTGNQNIAGIKTTTGRVNIDGIYTNKFVRTLGLPVSDNVWRRMYYCDAPAAWLNMVLLVVASKPTIATNLYGMVRVTTSTTAATLLTTDNQNFNSAYLSGFVVVMTTDGVLELWCKELGSNAAYSMTRICEYADSAAASLWRVDGVTTAVSPDFTDTSLYSSYKVMVIE